MDNCKKRPLIFIGNDDGYLAKGIKVLSDIAKEYGDVFIAAPRDHQSGKSSALTVTTPLRAKLLTNEPGLTSYYVTGTPVDCIKLAVSNLMPRTPDIVLSGINHGYNSGNSAIYSGTMGIAFEGSFLNVPSIGFSYGDYTSDADFTVCEPVVRQFIEAAIDNRLHSQGVCYNVNIPKCTKLNGLKAAIAAKGRWTEEYDSRIDPHGMPYYWLTGKYIAEDPDNQETDLYWLKRDYATVVPCRADQTAHDLLEDTSKLFD